jgi:hypothetical protein
VSGTAYLKEGPSHRVDCEDALLVAETPATRQSFRALFGDKGYAPELNVGRLANVADRENRIAYAKCAGDGHFTFSNVSKGRYFIVARTTWLLRWAHRGGFLEAPLEVTHSLSDVSVVRNTDQVMQ